MSFLKDPLHEIYIYSKWEKHDKQEDIFIIIYLLSTSFDPLVIMRKKVIVLHTPIRYVSISGFTFYVTLSLSSQMLSIQILSYCHVISTLTTRPHFYVHIIFSYSVTNFILLAFCFQAQSHWSVQDVIKPTLVEPFHLTNANLFLTFKLYSDRTINESCFLIWSLGHHP